MCKSTDAGLSWVLLGNYSGSTPLNAYFINASTGYVVNSSSELKMTTDGGTSWVNQTIPASGSFADITGSGSFAIIAGRKIATNTTVSIQQISNEVPAAFSLEQNFPNPFNPATTFNFSLPSSAVVSIKIYDIAGREVDIIANSVTMSAGTYSVNYSAERLSSGIYFYRITANEYNETKKMVLTK